MNFRFVPVFLITFLLTNFSARAQTARENDSLFALLKTKLNDSVRIKVWGDLVWNYAVENPSRSIQIAQEELVFAKQTLNNDLIGQALADLAVPYGRMGKSDSSAYYYQQALEYRKKSGNKERIAALQANLGTMYERQKKFSEAIQLLLEALKFYESSELKQNAAIIMGNIGNIYSDMDLYNKAYIYWKRAVSLTEHLGLSVYTAYNEANLSYYYYRKKQYDSAEWMCLSGLRHIEGTQNIVLESDIYTKLGPIYTETNRPEKAIIYLSKAIELKNLIGDSIAVYSNTALLAKAYIKTGQLKDAELLLIQSYKKSVNDRNIDWQERISFILYELYEKKGDYKSANVYLKVSRQLSDSIRIRENLNTVQEMESRFNLEKKEKANQLLASENEKIALQSQRKTLIIVFIVLGIIAVTAFFIVLLKRRKLSHELKLQSELSRQQDIAARSIIAAEDRERKRIAGDLHDGLGQMLSTVRVNLSAIKGDLKIEDQNISQRFENILALVDETCNETRSISHNMIPNALIKSGLASAVKEFLDKIDAPSLKINLSTHGLQNPIDSSIETVLYRVIQETVNNVIKHAGATQLDIQLIKDHDLISATIEDNGKGADINVANTSGGIGVKNMKSRIAFLKGKFLMESIPGQGMMVHVEIPL